MVILSGGRSKRVCVFKSLWPTSYNEQDFMRTVKKEKNETFQF